MMSKQVLVLVTTVFLTIVSLSTGADANYLAAQAQSSAVLHLDPLGLSTIGCGSILVGYELPPCPSTIDDSATHPAPTITELPIGGDGFGASPTYWQASIISVTGTPITSSSVVPGTFNTIASTLKFNSTTVTTTALPITVTKTVSQVSSESTATVTGLCYAGDSNDGILISCTKTLLAPIAIASVKSAAPRRAANPVGSFNKCPIYKLFAGDRSRNPSRRDTDSHIPLNRDYCAVSILAMVASVISVAAFVRITFIFHEIWRAGQSISYCSKAEMFLLLMLGGVWMALGLAYEKYC